MLNAISRVRGGNFSRKNIGIGGKKRMKLRRSSLETSQQWGGISCGGGEQQLVGGTEQNLGAVSINKKLVSSKEIST